MNLTEQLADLRATKAKKLADQTDIMTKAFGEKRTSTPEEQATFDALAAEIKALDGDIERVEVLEKANRTAAVSVPATPAAPGEVKSPVITVKSNAKPLEPGEGFGRWARVVAKAKGNLRGGGR